jgi:hypothetical protein
VHPHAYPCPACSRVPAGPEVICATCGHDKREIVPPPIVISEEGRALLKRAVDAALNDMRTDAQIIIDGVRFILGRNADGGTRAGIPATNRAPSSPKSPDNDRQP